MDLSELLISEVQKRPALWNLKGKAYHNRVIVDRDWRKVAEITGMSVGAAKVRWKNLRDHFRKELLKQPRANSEGSGEKKLSKWIHFDSLLFLKNVLKPRRAKGKLTVVIESCPDVNHGETEDQAVDEDSGDVDSSVNVPLEEKLQTALASQHLPPECDLAEMQTTARKYKLERNVTEGNSQDAAPSAFESQMMLKMETEKLSLLQSMEDDDFNFLKSLLPYMKSLPPIRKLMIRSQFQNLLVQEMINCQNNPSMLQTLSSSGGLSAADIIPSPSQE